MRQENENSSRFSVTLSRTAVLSASFLAWIALTGCAHSDYASRRLEQRGAGMERTLETLTRSEAERPAQLNRGLRLAAEAETRERPKKLARELRGAEEILRHDARRFDERQQAYVREIMRLLWGKPELIEKTAVDMFY